MTIDPIHLHGAVLTTAADAATRTILVSVEPRDGNVTIEVPAGQKR